MPVVIERREVLVTGLAALLAACSSPLSAAPRTASPRAKSLIEAARRQIGITLAYDSGYSRIVYPGGDIDRQRGVCTDVVIRAYRDAFGLDLQKSVHEDMARAFAAYPRRWGLSRPDANIDHRRVPNLETFWQRARARLPLPAGGEGWWPGDVFTSLVNGNLPHTGIVSDRAGPLGGPMVVHNIGGGTREESLSSVGRLTGRYRWQV